MTEAEKVRVLIVDDDEDDFVLTRDLLATQDRTRFDVEWASTPGSGSEVIREHRHDIYLIDHRLGELTGLDLLRSAFKDGALQAPVIMLTGYDDYEVDMEASMLGVTDFLIKGSLDAVLLERSIRYAIRHHAMLSELRTAQERYALAVRGANDGIWDWDLLTGEIHFGPRWKAMLGYGEDEIGAAPGEWFDRVRPEDRGPLHAALDAHLDGGTPHFESEYRIRHADGTYLWMLSRAVAVRDEEGKATRLAGSMSDITARKLAEDRLRHDALHDSLTGLPNRTLFLDHLELSLSRATRDPEYCCGVLFMDVNRFKLVNDGFSHAVGDKLLIALGARLKAELRPGDTIARFGGDEFTVLLHDIESAEAAVDVAERLQQVVAEPFVTDGQNLILGVSIGVAVSAEGSDAAELIRDADIAMYEAKHQREPGPAVFTSSMRKRMIGELRLESELREVLEEKRLRVFYQPIVEVETGAIRGLEALARWPEDAGRQIASMDFITVAESTGMIRPLGRLVLGVACRQMAAWRQAGRVGEGVTISVNVSAEQLGAPDLLEDVGVALSESGLPGERLHLEITEHAIMRDPNLMPSILEDLGRLGVKAEIDDFGTGYSSLNFLRHFAGNTLKIDRSFVASMCEDEGSAEIVRAIVDLGENLNLGVIAEGVETEAQRQMLRRLGVPYAQGFLYSPPLPADEIGPLLASGALSGGRVPAGR